MDWDSSYWETFFLFLSFLSLSVLPVSLNLSLFFTSTHTKKAFVHPYGTDGTRCIFEHKKSFVASSLPPTRFETNLTDFLTSQQWNATCLCAGVWSLPQVGWRGAGRPLYSAWQWPRDTPNLCSAWMPLTSCFSPGPKVQCTGLRSILTVISLRDCNRKT